MRQNEQFELVFQGEEPKGSHVSVDLEACFTWAGKAKTVKGFYAGNGVYKVRFLPQEAGEYQWRVSGCVNSQGQESCLPAMNNHKGILHAKGIHFEYEDGTRFLPVGTTIYALAHQKQALINQTMDTLKSAPFNKVRHCVFPKYYEYNYDDPEWFAFEKDKEADWDMDHPCFAFWDHLEEVIVQLAKMGIQSDLILFHSYDNWGFSVLSREQCLIYLEYLLRRLSSFPEIWWSMANEFDLMYARTKEDWYAIEEFIAKNDPYHHLLSNHNCFSFYDFNRPNITHCCVQTIQMEQAELWLKQYRKPLIYDECCYEGNLPQSWGNLSGFEMVNRFWQACVPGAYASHGEVYLAEDDVLWWAKGGVLKGSSPKRIQFLRNILEELPGTLEPWEQKPWEPPYMGLMSKAPGDLFQRLHYEMPQEQRASMKIKDGICAGKVGEEVFLEYFGHRCCGMTRWTLPDNRTYRIEIIDIWEMTRSIAYTGISGRFAPKLPGKEGIALLAAAE